MSVSCSAVEFGASHGHLLVSAQCSVARCRGRCALWRGCGIKSTLKVLGEIRLFVVLVLTEDRWWYFDANFQDLPQVDVVVPSVSMSTLVVAVEFRSLQQKPPSHVVDPVGTSILVAIDLSGGPIQERQLDVDAGIDAYPVSFVLVHVRGSERRAIV